MEGEFPHLSILQEISTTEYYKGLRLQVQK
jgi:hypothetical protein